MKGYRYGIVAALVAALTAIMIATGGQASAAGGYPDCTSLFGNANAMCVYTGTSGSGSSAQLTTCLGGGGGCSYNNYGRSTGFAVVKSAYNNRGLKSGLRNTNSSGNLVTICLVANGSTNNTNFTDGAGVTTFGYSDSGSNCPGL